MFVLMRDACMKNKITMILGFFFNIREDPNDSASLLQVHSIDGGALEVMLVKLF